MNKLLRFPIPALVLTFACAAAQATNMPATLTGAQEVPPVTTDAKATNTIVVGKDKSVTGSIATKGLPGTMAHIHLGAPGENGAVLITLTKGSNDTWVIPPASMLTDEQYTAYKAGKLYVNVHSAAHPAGEIRTQLSP